MKYVIFSDIDGTFLDRKTYKPGPALEAFRQCQRVNIPIVFVSAKTRAEIEPLQHELGNVAPFISENGGGLYIPQKTFACPVGFQDCPPYWRWGSPVTIEEIRQALMQAAYRTGIEVRGFGDMSTEEVADRTGLTVEKAELAKCREFDEPYIIVDEKPGQLDRLKIELAKHGYHFTSGGNLYHIMADFDKGESVRKLKDIYLGLCPDVRFIGVGDAFNDLPMLRLVDYPFLVRNLAGDYERAADIPGLTITDGIGPEGFCEVVVRFVE